MDGKKIQPSNGTMLIDKVSKRAEPRRRYLLYIFFLVLTVMLLFALVASADAADGMLYSQQHIALNWESNYSEFERYYLNGAGKAELKYVVPGLKENMVPQGLTFWEEKNCVLISAYDASEKDSSVIYALDFDTGEYVSEFRLMKKDGEANRLTSLLYSADLIIWDVKLTRYKVDALSCSSTTAVAALVQ